MEFVVAMGIHLHLAEQLKDRIGQHSRAGSWYAVGLGYNLSLSALGGLWSLSFSIYKMET